MSPPEFIVADVQSHRDELVELNVEYVSWVFAEVNRTFGVQLGEVMGMSAHDYVPSVIDKVCGKPPPEGIFYLVKVAGKLAGMGGLRGLDTLLSEVKRVYIRPQFRGARLGEQLLKRLIGDA